MPRFVVAIAIGIVPPHLAQHCVMGEPSNVASAIAMIGATRCIRTCGAWAREGKPIEFGILIALTASVGRMASALA